MAKHEKSAGAVIYYLENNKPKFLILQNTLKKTYWEFPKGKIEKNENIEDTVKREVEEETGLKNIEIIPGFKETLTWFFKLRGELIKKEAVYLLLKIPQTDKDKVEISSEHEKFSWMAIEEAMEKVNIKANRELVGKAYEFILEYEKQKKLF